MGLSVVETAEVLGVSELRWPGSGAWRGPGCTASWGSVVERPRGTVCCDAKKGAPVQDPLESKLPASTPAVERWEWVSSLFERLVEAPAAARQALLDEHAGQQPELRQELQELLKADDEAHGVLEEPAFEEGLGALQAWQEAKLPGPALERYRLVKELGPGRHGGRISARRSDQEYQQFVH